MSLAPCTPLQDTALQVFYWVLFAFPEFAFASSLKSNSSLWFALFALHEVFELSYPGFMR
jgi:hypothetical protein